MKPRVWHKGPPPHIGWWNASHCRFESIWRWWDGKCWSNWATIMASSEFAARYAEQKASNQSNIEWTHYYPENARVPRVNPNKGESL